MKTVRQSFFSAVVILLLSSLCWASTGPMDKVKLTVDQVLGILKTADLDRAAKREQLSTTIRDAFDFTSMAQRILARNWRKATPQQRQQFISLLSQLLEQSYIGNIENYTNEKVEFVNQRIKKNLAAIDTLIVTKSKEIPVSYRMLQDNSDWKVYDVVIESVSFVNNYRSSYGEIIKKEGMDGLLAKMEQKLAELQRESTQQ